MRQKYSKAQKKNFPFVYCLIAIPVIQFLIFWVFVHADSIALAFIDDATGKFTFDHFKEVWTGITNKDVYGFNLLAMRGCGQKLGLK